MGMVTPAAKMRFLDIWGCGSLSGDYLIKETSNFYYLFPLLKAVAIFAVFLIMLFNCSII